MRTIFGIVEPDSLKRSRALAAPNAQGDPTTIWYFPALISPRARTKIDRWSTPNFYRTGYFDPQSLGVRTCPSCKTAEKAPIDWPSSALYQTTIKRTRLFAQNLSDWLAIRAYIAAKNRRALYRSGNTHWAVRYLPATIIAAKNREAVLKAMDAALQS